MTTATLPEITCRNGHTTQDYFIDNQGKRRCRPCRRKSRNGNRLRQAPDGLEQEYGPTPDRDPDLVDWVVLYRIARYGEAARRLTRAESAVARKTGLYKNRTTMRQPSWTFNHYGDSMKEMATDSKGQVGSNVLQIENELMYCV